MIWKNWDLHLNREQWIKETKNFDRNIYFLEALFEAIPSTLIYVFLLWASIKDPTLKSDIMQDDNGAYFYVSFAFTIFSASLGLAKCLKSSSVSCLSDGGLLNGMLSGQFFFGWLACFAVFSTKAFMIGQTLLQKKVRRNNRL